MSETGKPEKEWDFAELKKRMQKKVTQPDIISLVDRFNRSDLTEQTRARMAEAMIEDEVVRLKSQEASKAYLMRKEEDDRVPFWMWCTLWFTLGILFMITLDNVTFHLDVYKVLFTG